MENLVGFLEQQDRVVQGALGTVFTWFVTALGAGVVFVIPSKLSSKTDGLILDFSLGFSGGVMLAASFWSLLAPAFEASDSFVPPTIGFLSGCVVVHLADHFLPEPTAEELQTKTVTKPKKSKRKTKAKYSDDENDDSDNSSLNLQKSSSYRRIMLLVLAMTVHNFPEGLAVGVAFGNPKGTTLEAIVLTIGIALQNFPEGLAVSLPLQRLGSSKRYSFLLGQLSGAVEIIGGVLGAWLVEQAQEALPYALGFAAGAMIFVVVDSIIPESHARGNKQCASWGAVVGFIVMMVMDVTLG